MNKVFLSHSSSDKEYVEYIADKFGKDIAVYDNYSFEYGLKTFDEILKSLDATDLFVIFISNAALESEWVKKELAISHNLLKNDKLKQIFPIIIDENITYTDPRIPEWLNTGFSSYNLRRISNRKLAYIKIRNQLILLNNQFNFEQHRIYVGHEDILKKGSVTTNG